LLKYLDDHKIMRLGSIKNQTIDCPIIAATNRDLEALVKSGSFRKDLFFRLESFTLHLPPLRDREEDILELIRSYLKYYNDKYHLNRRIQPAALEKLLSYSFPGNVRELKNILKKSVVMSDDDVLDDFINILLQKRTRSFFKTNNRSDSRIRIDDEPINLRNKVQSFERDLLKKSASRYKSTRKMAAHLGISQATVARKLKRYRLNKSR